MKQLMQYYSKGIFQAQASVIEWALWSSLMLCVLLQISGLFLPENLSAKESLHLAQAQVKQLYLAQR